MATGTATAQRRSLTNHIPKSNKQQDRIFPSPPESLKANTKQGRISPAISPGQSRDNSPRRPVLSISIWESSSGDAIVEGGRSSLNRADSPHGASSRPLTPFVRRKNIFEITQSSNASSRPPAETTEYTRSRISSPQKRLNFPTRWAPKSEMARPQRHKSHSSRQPSPYSRQAMESDSDSHKLRLLDTLGMAPIASGIEVNSEPPQIATRLPFFAPRNLQQCEDNCYWRWLVYTLLGDVGELRQTLEDTEEEIQQRAEQRREIEEMIGSRDRVMDDLESMAQSLEVLRIEVPARRIELKQLQGELAEMQQVHHDVLERAEQVKAKICRSTEWEREQSRIANDVEQSARVGQAEEYAVQGHIAAAMEETAKIEQENKELAAERDALRAEFNMLEEAKHGVKKKKSGKLTNDSKPTPKAAKKR